MNIFMHKSMLWILTALIISVESCIPDSTESIQQPEPYCSMNPYTVNFSFLEFHDISNLIYTYDMVNANIFESCKSITFLLNNDSNNPTGINEIFSHWWDSNQTNLDYLILSTGDIHYNATINGTFETFTEIVGGPYRLVPIRCSFSTPQVLNFSQVQINYNGGLVHTQNTASLTATEECDIIYVRGFDPNPAGVNGFNLYWDAGHTTITDAWIYSDSGQISSTIAGPNANILPGDFTSITGGLFQLVPVRP